MKHIIIAFLTLTLFVTSGCSSVFAQAATSSPRPTTTGRDLMQTRRAEFATRAAERREQFASQAAQRREAIQERLVEHREEIASKTAQLRVRLEQFRDQRKADLVERINDTLNMINENRTEAMRRYLESMSKLLDELQNRVNSKIAEGKDGTAANEAIASASGAIASASAAVDAQALKDYTIIVSSESAVRVDTKAKRDKLHNDLQAVRKLAIEAKQAVANAIQIAATTLGGRISE